MENATKALMIAGAVLIAIMIIGIGMMIYQSGKGTIDDAMESVDTIARDSFNNELLPYEGAQKGTQVKALITRIISLNASNAETHPERVITLNFDGSTITDLSAQRASVTAGLTYTVTTAEDTTTGYITTISITSPKK